MLCRRALELATKARQSDAFFMLPFLNERQQMLCTAEISKLKCDTYFYYGGYDNAERKMLGISAQTPSVHNFPIQAVNIKAKADVKNLTHRDYLGAIMSLRISRDNLGDIILSDSGAVLFVHARVADIIVEELCEIGRVSVSVQRLSDGEIPQIALAQRAKKTVSVTSLRLDVLLSAISKLSRSNAAQTVASKGVQVNNLCVQSVHFKLMCGDVIAVKGRGKYKITQIGGKSKKGNTFVEYEEY